MNENSLLFAHVPWRRADASGAVRRRLMALPTGLFGLASRARRASWASSIVHVGLEQIRDPSYELEQTVAKMGRGLVGFDLHWHPQIGEVLETARRVKQARPDLGVLLGGMTASAFHREILEHAPWVDYLIRGEAEGPLERLLEQLARPSPELRNVPNLSFREGGRVLENPLGWLASSADLDDVELDLDVLENRELYDGAIEHPVPEGAQDPLWGRPRSFHVLVGRGCSRSCAYCGGAAAALARNHGRTSLVLRSPERVERELRYLAANGFHTSYFAFDPPGTAAFYLELFERVARGGALPGAVLEHYDGLPSDALLQAMVGAFSQRTVVLSPGSAVPAIRARHLLMNPDNAAFERAVDRIRDHGVNALLYFTLFPDDTVETLEATASWMAALASRGGVALQFANIEVEPGAGWSENPARHGVELRRQTFQDFLAHHRSGDPFDLGYAVRDEASKRRILAEVIRPLITAPARAVSC